MYSEDDEIRECNGVEYKVVRVDRDVEQDGCDLCCFCGDGIGCKGCPTFGKHNFCICVDLEDDDTVYFVKVDEELVESEEV